MSDPNGERRGSTLHPAAAAAIAVSTLLWWAFAAALFASATPPDTAAPGRWAAATFVAAFAWSIVPARWPEARRTGRVTALPVATATCVAVVLGGQFFAPYGDGALLVALLLLVSVPVVAALAIVAVVTARRHPGRALIVLLLTAMFAVTVRSGDAIGDEGTSFRFEQVRADYERSAADPVPTGATRPDEDGRIVARSPDGRLMVGWSWARGIPAAESGPVFDPDGLLDDEPGTTFRAGTYRWNGNGCRPFAERWQWCDIY